MNARFHPVTLLVPASSAEPMELVIEGYGLRMTVVNKESLSMLDDSWDQRGLYFLLGRAEEPDRYTAYVGKATVGLRARVREHVRTREQWDRALLLTSDERGFDSAAIGWLEGRFWDVLQNAAAAVVLNRNQPRDESVPEYRRHGLERYVEPVMSALRALGASPDTADQKPPPPPDRRRRVFTESVKDLIDAGLLKPGTRLRPLRRKYDEPATVLPDGSLDVDGEVFMAVSPAAQRVSGNSSEPGWEFWGAPSGDGSLVSLYELRERLRSGAAASEGHPRPAPPAPRRATPSATPASEQPRPSTSARRRRFFGVKVAELITAGLLAEDETIVALRKRVGEVEAVLHPDGTVTVNGQRHSSLSRAAEAVSGTTSEPGWQFWAVRRDQQLVRLYDVRAEYLAERGASS